MASFVMAMTINPSAKKEHADLANKINESLEVFTANKVKVSSVLATLGRYDYLALFDAPDQGAKLSDKVIPLGRLGGQQQYGVVRGQGLLGIP